ncbi:MAG: matrixin family metalloprotease, partial [Acidimicrobiia bacterium]
AVALIFVAAAVFLVIGITTHEEPTFRSDAIQWAPEDFPLEVCASDRRGQLDDGPIRYVVQTVNQRLDMAALAYVGASEGCDVVITMGVPAEPGWMDPGGEARWRPGGRVCYVSVSNVHGEMVTLVLYHELGHCLGLDHDDYDQSIMRPVQRETPDRAIPPWISDADRAAIRARYLP